jgi:subtilisin-like proprotein convertase family protein
MKRSPWILAVALACSVAVVGTALAVPSDTTYTGRLSASNGLPFDGEVAVIVRVFDQMMGGTEVDSEDLGTVSVENGVLRVSLASIEAPALGADDLWLEFQIGSEVLSPRQKLVSTPFAHRAGDADALGGLPSSAFLSSASGVTNEALPSNGLAAVSNFSMSNEFSDVAWSWGEDPTNIPDYPGTGTSASVTTSETGSSYVTDITIFTTFTLEANSKIIMKLVPPPSSGIPEITLIDGSEALISDTYDQIWTPATVPQLQPLLGTEVQGEWFLTVVDIDETLAGTTAVGTLDSFEILYDVVRSDHVKASGLFEVAGDLSATGEASFGEASVAGTANLMGGAKLGHLDAACDETTEGAIRYDATSKRVEFCNGTSWADFAGPGATYRYVVWSTYDQSHSQWYAGNNGDMFGGVTPQTWSDSNGLASQMTSDFDKLRTFFTQEGPPIGTLKNAMVVAQEWYYNSSTNGRHAAVLFRIRNNTASAITWTPFWYRTSYGGYNEYTSIALNGTNSWNSSGDNGAHAASSHNLSIPGGRTSTVIFVVGSSSGSGTRGLFLAFYNDSLVLPDGLEFVDDFDTKPNGWDN